MKEGTTNIRLGRSPSSNFYPYTATRMAIADERASEPTRLPFNPWLGLTKRQAIKILLDEPKDQNARKRH